MALNLLRIEKHPDSADTISHSSPAPLRLAGVDSRLRGNDVNWGGPSNNVMPAEAGTHVTVEDEARAGLRHKRSP